MTILTADILDRDPVGMATLRACLATDSRYAGIRTLASSRKPGHKPFARVAPRGTTLHGFAMAAVLAASAAAAGVATRFGGF